MQSSPQPIHQAEELLTLQSAGLQLMDLNYSGVKVCLTGRRLRAAQTPALPYLPTEGVRFPPSHTSEWHTSGQDWALFLQVRSRCVMWAAGCQEAELQLKKKDG